MLELSFRTRDLRALCEDDTQALARLGTSAADALRHRIEDLRAATSVCDLIVGSPRMDPALANGSIYVIDLADGWTLRFQANHARLALTKEGMVDWRRVSRIQIMDIARVTS